MLNIPNYVISLITADIRRKHIEEEFGKQNIPFIFFDAITPDIIEETAKQFNITFDTSSKATLAKGEIACALSHIVLWDLMVKNNIPYLSIFEDDIYLGESVQQLLDIDYLPDDVDILKLETSRDRIIHYPPIIPIKNERIIFRLKNKHTGTAGYTITLKGARFLLNKMRNRFLDVPIDVLIFDDFFRLPDYKVMQLSPALCIQDFLVYETTNFKSSLQDGRNEVHENQLKSTFIQKVRKEWLRVKRKMFGRVIAFK